VSEEGGDKGTVVKQLVGLINQQVGELRKKGDKANLDKAIKGFTEILDELVRQGKPNAEFVLYLSQCYAGMGQHAKAARELDKVPEPKGADGQEPDPKALSFYHAIRLLLVRQLRLTQDEVKDKKDYEANLEKAARVLDEIQGTKASPGWGARNIDALKERIYLMIAQEHYAEAARLANSLVKQLLTKTGDNTFKEHYLECYYLQVLALYKHAQVVSNPARKEKEMREAGTMVAQLEKKWENFGTDASRKRFTELLDKEPELKSEYEKQKK